MEIRRIRSGPILSEVVEHGGLVYIAGTTADNTGAPAGDQMSEIVAKIDRLLKEADTDKSRLLSATIYIVDIKFKPAINEVWKRWISASKAPVRACVVAGLEEGELVEMVVVAAKD